MWLRRAIGVVIGLHALPLWGAGEPPKLRYPQAPRLVAVGDLHGDIHATRRVLRLAGAIDEAGSWIGGDLVLVQTGDQLDRGDGEIAIFDLFDELAVQAAAAGGAVHALNGNHELMNVEGKMRYVTPGGFAAFARHPDLAGLGPPPAGVDLAEWPRRAAFAPGGPFALRLARRNVVTIVGDSVFVHGGVLPPAVVYGLAKLNDESQRWLRGDVAEPPSILLSRWGPVWSRHYSKEPDDADCAMLARTLRMLGAARMVVGHTVQEGGPSAYCGGLVWCIDTGMAAHYGGPAAFLEVTGSDVTAVVAGEPPRAAARWEPGYRPSAATSPLPARTTIGSGPERSTTVDGSLASRPASTTRSTSRPRSSSISAGSSRNSS